jgi:hypothetical protein
MLPAEPTPTRLDAERYFALAARGDLGPDDRVELLEGVVVSMPPQGSAQANAIARITALLVPSIGTRGVVRVRLRWAETRPARRGERVPLAALPGLSLAVDEMLPRR